MNEIRYLFAVAAALLAAGASAATKNLVNGTLMQSAPMLAQQPSGTTLPAIAPPPASGPISCAGFANTRVLELDWKAPSRLYTAKSGGFGLMDALVVKFTTGSVSSNNDLPHITVAAEYTAAPSSRTAVLSATPCDFSRQADPGANMNGNTVTAIFALGSGSGSDYYPVLKTNTTYYLNIRNDPGSNCVAGAPCDMSIDLIKGPL